MRCDDTDQVFALFYILSRRLRCLADGDEANAEALERLTARLVALKDYLVERCFETVSTRIVH